MLKHTFDKIVSKSFLIRKSFFPKKIILNFHNLKDFRSFDLGREYPEICENILDVKLFEEETVATAENLAAKQELLEASALQDQERKDAMLERDNARKAKEDVEEKERQKKIKKEGG